MRWRLLWALLLGLHKRGVPYACVWDWEQDENWVGDVVTVLKPLRVSGAGY